MDSRSLGSIPGGTLLTITGMTRVAGEYGEFALANFTAVLNGKLEVGRVRIPSSVLESTTVAPPCFLLYRGLKSTKSG